MQEMKVLDKNGVTVTTERIIYRDSKVIPLDVVKGLGPFVDRPWAWLVIFGGLAFFAFAQESVMGFLGGMAALAVGIWLFRLMTTRELLIATDGDGIHLKVKTSAFLKELETAIREAISMRRGAQRSEMRDEIDSLPSI